MTWESLWIQQQIMKRHVAISFSLYKTKPALCSLAAYSNNNTNGRSDSVSLQSRHANPLRRRHVAAFFFLLRSSSGRVGSVWKIRFRSIGSRIGSRIFFQYDVIEDHDHHVCCFHWSPVTSFTSRDSHALLKGT